LAEALAAHTQGSRAAQESPGERRVDFVREGHLGEDVALDKATSLFSRLIVPKKLRNVLAFRPATDYTARFKFAKELPMITRREAIKTIALTTGALTAASALAQAPAAPQEVFKLPPLGFDYDALEPLIDAETMKIHHDKHHAAYVAKLNAAIAKDASLASKSIEDLLQNLDAVPEAVRTDIRNHGGGHFNHTLFWQHLKKGTGAAQGDVLKAIEKTFGSFAKWQESFGDTAMKVFGSGWAWLVLRKGKLAIESTPNQDSPMSTGGLPLLGIDVWEHAYYLKYQNRRADYVKAFQDVINWEFVGDRFKKLQN
jgi:Fe-Mn family superoxide dismutase